MTRSGLIFSWRKKAPSFAVLGGFLVASLLAHALGFYIFHVVYQPSVTLPPNPVRITFLPPNAAGSDSLLNWIAAEDPAIPCTPREEPPETILHPLRREYIPSYAVQSKTGIFPAAPEPSIDSSLGLARMMYAPPPQPSPSSAAGKSAHKAKPPNVHGRFHFGPSLKGRVSESAEVPLPAETAALHRLVFQIALAPNGQLLHVFLLESSSSAAVDRAVESRLRKLDFLPAPSRDVIWENVALHWQLSAP